MPSRADLEIINKGKERGDQGGPASPRTPRTPRRTYPPIRKSGQAAPKSKTAEAALQAVASTLSNVNQPQADSQAASASGSGSSDSSQATNTQIVLQASTSDAIAPPVGASQSSSGSVSHTSHKEASKVPGGLAPPSSLLSPPTSPLPIPPTPTESAPHDRHRKAPGVLDGLPPPSSLLNPSLLPPAPTESAPHDRHGKAPQAPIGLTSASLSPLGTNSSSPPPTAAPNDPALSGQPSSSSTTDPADRIRDADKARVDELERQLSDLRRENATLKAANEAAQRAVVDAPQASSTVPQTSTGSAPQAPPLLPDPRSSDSFTGTNMSFVEEFYMPNIRQYIENGSGQRPLPRCSICTNELIVGGLEPVGSELEPIEELSCHHIIGAECMRAWRGLQGQDAVCPVCRQRPNFWRELSQTVNPQPSPQPSSSSEAEGTQSSSRGDMYLGLLRLAAGEILDRAIERTNTTAPALRSTRLSSGIPRRSPYIALQEAIFRYLRTTRRQPSDSSIDEIVRDTRRISQQVLALYCERLWDLDDNLLIDSMDAGTLLRAPTGRSGPVAPQTQIPPTPSDVSMHDVPRIPSPDMVPVFRDGLSRQVVDPEVRDEQGRFRQGPAKVLGRLAMRGRMVVELPSLNRPDCPRRYTVRTKQHNLRWGGLQSIARPDKGRLKSLLQAGLLRPVLVGVSSSPDCNFHHLLIKLPFGDRPWTIWQDEWHSRSDVESTWGSYRERMEEYWLNSGQRNVFRQPPDMAPPESSMFREATVL